MSRDEEGVVDGGPRSEPLLELVEVMARLRRDCPWKAGQTHLSLARYLLEESYEVLEALEGEDPAHLREELGDLLLQIYFHAAIAAERGDFDIDDVAADLIAKLHRRNPHVFGDGSDHADPADAAAVNEQWEAIKATEKRRTGLMDGVPAELPALVRAVKALERLERAGRTARPPAPGARDGVRTDPEAELGDRLLALVAQAHRDGIDPEQALRGAVRRLTGPE